MTQPGKWRWLFWFLLPLSVAVYSARATATPEVNNVLQHGFPLQPDALTKTTSALFSEYTNKRNIASLVFYSYGVLRQAKHFSEINDFIHAAEYAKTGLFYLDEAVDANEDNLRVRYLRARIDAYLPTEMGRCVVTLHDTDLLLKSINVFDKDSLNHIRYMRYRALVSCNFKDQANALLNEIKSASVKSGKHFIVDLSQTPEWDIHEITQIVLPLLKGK
ncbi:hypothetical protein Q5705_08725 [Kosakonia sp. H02]|nr:hypothetical protein Q5705_08725 [Kosakonia sp. H02]